MSTLRTQSLQWWNQLSSAQKTQICDTNTELVGNPRRWETLTGREIEEIYKQTFSQSEITNKK